LPHIATLQDIVVGGLEHLGLDNTVGDLRDLVAGGPDITEEDGLALLVVSKGLCFEIEVNGAGKGVGNNKRRGGQVVSTGVRVNTALEVSVTRKDSSGNHITFDNGILNTFWDLTRVTDAGHTTVTGSGESKCVQVGLKASSFVVLGDDVGARGE
jgi:hypothetical protein